MRSKKNPTSKSTLKTTILLFLLFIGFGIPAQLSCQSPESIENKLDDYMNVHLQDRSFMGSILLARDGRILVSKGYGMANLEHDVPNTPQTKFRLGSITKQFTSMSIMQLQKKGLLNVNDTFDKYIPDFKSGDLFTIHHLLTHTSGVISFTGFPDYRKTMILPLTLEEIIAKFKGRPLEFESGSQFKYSNSGYILLGYIIEKVSGLSYADYIKENIFDPLGMGDTGYDSHRMVLKNRATGYISSKERYINSDYIDMKIPHAAGALYSTVEDLYKWDRALYTDKLIDTTSLEKMFTPFKNGYGYGWGIGTIIDHKRIAHNGGINGFVTHIGRFPEDDACIIILSNQANAKMRDIVKDVTAILFDEPYSIPEIK
ncbi:serine hydrolase domain-containing protein [Acidobacteriota bacterium]